MTDNEIFANEILCIRRRSSGSCNGGTDCNSCDLIMEDSDIISAYERAMKSNDLINRQKAEIDILIRKKESLRDEIAEQQAEIERLNKENKQIRNDCRWCEEWQTTELLGERAKVIKEFAEKITEIFLRYAHLHNYADQARRAEVETADGTKFELFSVWDALSLKKHEMAEYEEMSELQHNIEYIANDRLLTELEKDFRLLVKEMTSQL